MLKSPRCPSRRPQAVSASTPCPCVRVFAPICDGSTRGPSSNEHRCHRVGNPGLLPQSVAARPVLDRGRIDQRVGLCRPRNPEAGPSPKVRPPEAIQVRLSWAVAGLAICSASLELEQPDVAPNTPPTPAPSPNPRAATSADPPPGPTARSTTPGCSANKETASAKSRARPASRRHHCTATSRWRPNKDSDRGGYLAEQGFMYQVTRPLTALLLGRFGRAGAGGGRCLAGVPAVDAPEGRRIGVTHRARDRVDGLARGRE